MRRLWMGMALTLALVVPARPARAVSTLSFQATLDTAEDGVSPVGKLFCGQHLVLTIGGGGWQCLNLTQDLAKRLNGLAERGLRAAEITVRRDKRTRALVARGETLIVVDPDLAQSQHASPEGVADSWLRALRAPFKRPYLSMEALTIPVGERRMAPLVGNLFGRIEVTALGAGITASWDAKSASLVVQGENAAQGTLVVTSGSLELRVPVLVEKYAAQLIAETAAVVTGDPATPQVLAEAVRSAVEASLRLEPGATSDVRAWLADGLSLDVGRSLAVAVSIVAQGPDYLPFRARPTVFVRNEALPLEPASLLLVSNSPERLPADGVWFEAALGDQTSARLLYHHVNCSSHPAALTVELWNTGDRPARVHMIPGVAGPSYDEAWVGHRAALQFLTNAARGSGWTLTIPPGTAVMAISQDMPRSSIASGVVELRTLGTARVNVRVCLREVQDAIGAHAIQGYEPVTSLGHSCYPHPRREVKTEYRVGQSWTFITLGDKPTQGLLGDDLLQGSYGVLYDITLTLDNPTSAPAQVQLVMEQAGGPARGALLVDGHPVEAAMVRNIDESPLAHYALAPGERRRVHIITMPQAGSNYPVRLVAKPL